MSRAVSEEWPERPEPSTAGTPDGPGPGPVRTTEEPPAAPAHRSGRRDRHGRGRRGPDHRAGLPDPTGATPLAPDGVPATRTRRQRFDQVALDVLDDVEARLGDRLPPVDVAVEDVPAVPAGWLGDQAPLGTLVDATRTSRARIVLYRHPIEYRTHGLAELTALVLVVVVDQVADLLGADPATLHPGYPQDD
ncbi:hypothetical protein GCM10011519_32950 [Marmoricola endophyticus]|uniref:Metallopeptidase family protein n=1 Tax=Marmoricola endophyticus TaxID=2040280 RepID=A0A917BVN1_9ACTN|nr:metallopeptidase family protein [Marmoricola endophyticus]GGF56397.1 hypothetical protein GCM10011519_32950 [Marmoricola endophyticus]